MMLYFSGVCLWFLGDGGAHEEYAAPQGAGESERPVRGHVTHKCCIESCNPPLCQPEPLNLHQALLQINLLS